MKILTETEIKSRLPEGFENISFESEAFRKAYSAILAKENDNLKTVFIIGAGGCGKSVLYQIAAKSHKCLCMAPTGVAASNVKSEEVEANTIHTALKLPVSDIYPLELNREALKRLAEYEMVLIDEVSMVNSNLFDFLMLHFSVTGIKVVFFGDPMQLEPTYKGWIKGKNPGAEPTFTEQYFTDDSPKWQSRWNKAYPTYYNSLMFYDSAYYYTYLIAGLLETVFLSSVYRQKNAEYKAILEAIRRGEYGDKEKKYLTPYCRDPQPDSVILAPTNEMVRKMNKQAIEEYLKTIPEETKNDDWFSFPAPLFKFEQKEKDGNTYINAYKMYPEEYCNTDNFKDRKEEAIYFVGERVMCTKNIFSKQGKLLVPNGAVGTIISFELSEVEELTSKMYDSEKYQVPVVLFKIGKDEVRQKMDYTAYGMAYYNKFKQSYVQGKNIYAISLTEAYAITYHKSQGLTLEKAHLVISNWVESGNGMLYLGLSRVKDPSGLSLSALPKKATASSRSVGFLDDKNIWKNS